MPAIRLAHLKTQAALLTDKFSEPGAFMHDLNELLDFYTNRTMRTRQIAQRLSLPTHQTPAPVLRQVLFELAPLANTRAAEAIILVDALWKAGSLETRLLAAQLLGSIPPSQALTALTRLPEWLAQSTDKEIQTALLTHALARLRQENPAALFIILEDWFKSPNTALQVWGMQALTPILLDPHFENLPAVFRILRPAVISAGPVTQLTLQACLATLERVSRSETLAFLREVIGSSSTPLMLRTLQRILPGLSPEMRTSLRDLLRNGNTP